MGAKKPMALHTSHHTKAELAVMEEENQVATCSRSCLEGKPPKELIDTKAKAEWKRIAAILQDMEIIGDLDKYALIGYCNAYSLYNKITEELSKQPFLLETEKGRSTNPLINVQDRFAKQMRDFAVKAGISVNTRLTLASVKVKKDDDEIANEFGL